jgi:hypothetical protein
MNTRRKATGAVAALVCLLGLLPGCDVVIEDQSGADLCDPNPCEGRGVCSGFTATCSVVDDAPVCSGWGGEGLEDDLPPGYEAVEATCDGLDNDCDGLTDEGVVGDPASDCSTEGACGDVTPALACVGGAWVCDYSASLAWQATETRCDAVDNDCDGETDETAIAGPFECKRSGVCVGLAPPTCTAGAWDCHYDEATDYEAVEESCDGKDNDCDGVADAGLSAASLPDGETCKSDGVCAAGVSIVCDGGVARCAYAQVPDYEAVEQSCDGKDNDCDGSTDTYSGGGAPLEDTDVSTCASAGVCGSAAPGVIVRRCQGGAFVCDYTEVLYYEAAEESCDARDNDCDGSVDPLGMPPPDVSPCGSTGVCAAGQVSCVDGLWQCDFAGLAAAGYEPFEMTCDGKDNDCDGETDEVATALGDNGCLTNGVCANGVAVACTDGQPTCDYSGIVGYEQVELSCDGVDNDCDGETDEAADLDVAASGCALGVCDGVANATCANGGWQCSFAGVADYEAVETSCDGKDNDCDGQTDEALSDTAAAGCKIAGVCAAGTQAACVDASYICQYPPTFQAAETLCDGLDNDCDGLTDPGICAAGESCVGPSACAGDGGCVSVLGGGDETVCTALSGQCAVALDAGGIGFANSGDAVCAGSGSTATCNAGSFGAATPCPDATPACVDGTCQVCVPNEKSCDPNDSSVVVQCNGDGSAFTTAETCGGGEACTEPGFCVVEGVQSYAATDDNSSPIALPQPDGTLQLVWLAKTGGGNVTRRLGLDDKGAAAGGSSPVSASSEPVTSQVSDTAARLAGARSGSTTALAWSWNNGFQGNDVVVRLFDGSFAPLDSEINLTDAFGDQDGVAIAANDSGFAVVWSAENSDSGGRGIRLQRLDTQGTKQGEAILVNAQTALQDDPEAGDQFEAAVAALPAGGWVVVWNHDDDGSNQSRIRARVVSAAGAVVGDVVTINNTQVGAATRPSVAVAGEVIFVAWEVNKGGQVARDVRLRRFDTSLAPLGSAVDINTTTAKNQRDPQMFVHGDEVQLTWSSQEAVSAANGLEVSRRSVLSNGVFTSPETVATLPGAGEQDEAQPVVLPDGRVFLLWRHRDTFAGSGQVRGRFL